MIFIPYGSPMRMIDKPQAAEVTRRGKVDMQVCVPQDWTDTEVEDFAERKNPSGTLPQDGWHIRKEGDPLLGGDSERIPCNDLTNRPGFIHVVLDTLKKLDEILSTSSPQ